MLTGSTNAEAPILWLLDTNTKLVGEDPEAGKDWRQKEKRAAEDEMVVKNHWSHGYELGKISGDSEGQGSLACSIPWDHKESDRT